MANLLLRRPAAEARSSARVRWRWRERSRRLRDEERTRGVLPGALGARRPALLFRLVVPRPLQGWRFHRIPRLVESRARAPRWIQRGVRSFRGRKTGRSVEVRSLCGRLRRRGKAAGPRGAPPRWPRARTRRRHLLHRRPGWTCLEGHVQGFGKIAKLARNPSRPPVV